MLEHCSSAFHSACSALQPLVGSGGGGGLCYSIIVIIQVDFSISWESGYVVGILELCRLCPFCSTQLTLHCSHTVGVNIGHSAQPSLHCMQSHCWGEQCAFCSTQLALHCSHTVGVNIAAVHSALRSLHCLSHTVGVNIAAVHSALLSLHCMQSHCWGEHWAFCSTQLALHCSHTVGVNSVHSALPSLHCIAVTLLG